MTFLWEILTYVVVPVLLTASSVAAQSCYKPNNRLKPEVEQLCSGFEGLLKYNITEQSIEVISFTKNRITAIDSSSFGKNPIVATRIDLDNNKIGSISPSAFQNVPYLREIDLSHNQLEILNPDTFAANKDLETVDLRGNKVKFLNVALIANLNSLKQLILSDNPLEVCDPTTATTLAFLEGNNIETLFLKSCPESTTERVVEVTDDVDIINETIREERFVPLVALSCAMLLPVFILTFIVTFLLWKLRKYSTKRRTRATSGNYLIPGAQRRFSRGSEEDGYLRPTVPQNPAQYLEVLGSIHDSNYSPVISMESNNSMWDYKIPHLLDSPVLQASMPMLYGYRYENQDTHTYEEIPDTHSYTRNIVQHNLHQPYGYIKK